MSVMGVVLFSTMALASPFLQNVLGYPIITAGLLLASRGFGTFVAMMMVGRLMRHIEARTLIVTGLSMTCVSLFWMTAWTDQTGVNEILVISIFQGFGFGLVFVPLSTVAFLTLPNHLRTDGTSMLTLLRNVGELDRHFPRDLAADRGIAVELRGAVAARQSVQPRDADAARCGP